MILKRQPEGFDTTGVNFGRSKKEITEEFKGVYRKRNNGELTAVEQ